MTVFHVEDFLLGIQFLCHGSNKVDIGGRKDTGKKERRR
jgi:hypothetical protein